MSSETSDQDREPFVEVDPSGRFGRYSDLLGVGAVKKVYRGLSSEVELLQTLENENIIGLYSFWRDVENNTLNFITKACASGNLRDYRKKHRHVSLKAMKNWSRQILRGLEYLQTHEPCIIHRDLNCSNIFINGNIGKMGFTSGAEWIKECSKRTSPGERGCKSSTPSDLHSHCSHRYFEKSVPVLLIKVKHYQTFFNCIIDV
ncbi:putative protein kinase WNK-NRBP family [Helianthus anomalus]